MKEVEALSDAELRDELVKLGVNCGPVTGTTRAVYEKKYLKLVQAAGKSEPKVKKSPVATKATKTPSQVRPSRKANRSESEDGSDEEIVSPRGVSAKKGTKPVTSTPTKDRTPSPPPKASRSPGRPANKIIPGLNTTVAGSVGSTKKIEKKTTGTLVIGSPSGDHPGHTPPRSKGIQRTPIRNTRTSTTITSSFLSPDVSFGSGSPSVSKFSPSIRRSILDVGHTTDEDDDDEGEESCRVVHNISSTGTDKRSGLRKTMDSFMGNAIRASPKPGGSYELRRGTNITNVVRDPKSGRVSIKQKSVFSDISTILIIILTVFFVLLGIAYLVASSPETISSTVGTVTTAAKDTVSFVYTYAVLPAVLIAVGVVVVGIIYFGHKRYEEAKAKEQVAFEELVEKIIDTVQSSSEDGEESISVPHVRDIMYPATKRRAADLARWEKAVEFINENDSRIATEVRMIRGQECQVWRWLPYKKSGWQGNAYASPKINAGAAEASFSANVPTEALTRCLKIRDVHEDRTGKHPKEPVNYSALKLAVLEKIHPVRPVHMDFDHKSGDGVLYMKLACKDDAKDAFSALHTTWFNGHLINVKYMRDNRYDERFPVTSNV